MGIIERVEDAPLASALADLGAFETEVWDTSVVSAVVACASEDSSICVRLQACSLLAEEALRGSGQAAAAVVSRLLDPLPRVRTAALEDLKCLVACGPVCSVKAATDTLRHLDSGCRWRSSELSAARAMLVVAGA